METLQVGMCLDQVTEELCDSVKAISVKHGIPPELMEFPLLKVLADVREDKYKRYAGAFIAVTEEEEKEEKKEPKTEEDVIVSEQ